MPPPVLMLFVDGLGLAPAADGPVSPGVCPRLLAFMREDGVAVDACLGVPGLPQSATGQTALLTGINAPARVGRHVEGFPGRELREIIERHNLFRQVREAGLSATFANGYLAATVEEVHAMRVKSVTTVAALAALGDVRRRPHLMARRAVAHDLTRESLARRGYVGETLTPAQAAGDLAALARRHDFTLFEFFQTDRAGHAGDPRQAAEVLRKYDVFLAELLARTDADGILTLLTSDHGNIEDLSVRTHTRHPVPLAARGPGAEAFRAGIRTLCDIAPAVMRHLRGAADLAGCVSTPAGGVRREDRRSGLP